MPEKYIIFDQESNLPIKAFVNPTSLIIASEPKDVAQAFIEIQQAHSAGKWLAGFASYELGYVFEERLLNLIPQNRLSPLLCFGVFDAPDIKAAKTLISQAHKDAPSATLSPPKALWSIDDYKQAFKQIKSHISAGNLYQTNLTFPMQSHYQGTPLGLYAALRHHQPVNYGGLVNLGYGPILLSRSPELFFKINANNIISTRPMKGTVPRGKTQGEDADLISFLKNDRKNRAENLMIVDLLRNDISRIAKVGSVRVPELFTIETYATVHQMTSLIEAELLENLRIADIFKALFPCGSITGAPKLSAMKTIRQLENNPRDIYCGSIGWIAPNGEMTFNVAIRTLSLYDDYSVRLNVGGGVVYDSTAVSEYEEALWKARYTKIRPRENI